MNKKRGGELKALWGYLMPGGFQFGKVSAGHSSLGFRPPRQARAEKGHKSGKNLLSYCGLKPNLLSARSDS